ncbi:hypothetical protein Csa_023698, partial [Cucumis sativus]
NVKDSPVSSLKSSPITTSNEHHSVIFDVPSIHPSVSNCRSEVTVSSLTHLLPNTSRPYDIILHGAAKSFAPSSHVVKNHPSSSIIGDASSGITTRKKER